MSIPQDDFYSIFQGEGDFYDEIHSLDQEKFNEWVSNSFEKIATISSFNEVAPSENTINEFRERGYIHKESQCHYSAKAISLLNPEFEYWTGFINRDDYLYPIVTHSFNLYKGKVIDLARVDKHLKPLDIESTSLPHVYYGIKIPHDFVKKYEKETFNEFSMEPLLVDWYKANND
ncbi:hypothetical protein PbJCM13498_38960 [Prolixibacter bellariivorans]|uniref:Uncharacterized protein n=1 Tax=Prolixibacter bellariivorans TaxID=314319 RepID=A0A5M4B592_9BACT|nr:hypothetical protein [Prolixibacter bellariivorans]GET35033.1 hypothetical protein PbJCM13498_38960 [Prolixibacter bellariivorans]